MRDLPAAGAAWFGTARRGTDVDEAVEAWRERHGDHFAQMWSSLPRSVREREGNKRVDALRRRAEQVGSRPAGAGGSGRIGRSAGAGSSGEDSGKAARTRRRSSRSPWRAVRGVRGDRARDRARLAGPRLSGETSVGVGGPPLVRPAWWPRSPTRCPAAVGEDCVRVAVDGVDGAGQDDVRRRAGGGAARPGRDRWWRSASTGGTGCAAERYARGRGRRRASGSTPSTTRGCDEVLEPLVRVGHGDYRPRGTTCASDEVLRSAVARHRPASVVVVDGLFLQREELEGCFEFACGSTCRSR